jgi:parvulin-like peptidyl-prolyl isomerase
MQGFGALSRTLGKEPHVEPEPARSRPRHRSMHAVYALLVTGLWVALAGGCAHSWQNRVPQTSVGTPSKSATTPLPSATPSPLPSATATPPLAARVNGQPILLSDLEREIARATGAGIEQSTVPAAVDAQAKVEEQVLERMIAEVLVAQTADQLGITPGLAEVDAQVRADVSAGGGSLAFAEWLTATDQTYEEYAAAVRTSLLLQRVALAVTAGLPSGGEQVHLRRIEVDSLEAADGLLARIQQGEDFSKLAVELAADTTTGRVAGDMGWVPRGVLDSQAEAMVFALQPSQVAGVAAEDSGKYALFQLVERETDRPYSPAVQAELRAEAFRRWLAEKRAKAAIERLVGQ